MKTKKMLSLTLALVMALSLAVPAFAAGGTTVVTGDVYQLDASAATIAVADTDTDGTDDEWSITLAGQKGVLTTQTAADGDTADAAAIGEWVTAVSSNFTGWSVSNSGTTVLFTATADGATVPTGATVKELAPAKVDSLDGLAAGGSTNISGSTNVPTIDVIIPKTGSAVLNPYKLSVTPAGGTATTNQIISAMQYVKSTSDVPLKVNISATATPTSNVTLSAKTAAAATTRQAYMYLNTKSIGSTATAPTESTVTFDAFNKLTSVVLTAGKAVTLNGLELAAGNVNPSYLAFRLEGDMATAPTTAWTTADKVDVVVAFSFIASALTPATP